MCTVYTCVYNVFICLHGFVMVCLRIGYPNSNGSWIIYDYLSCSQWQRLFYGVYRIPDFQTHPYIYNSTENHCGMCTLHISVPNHVLWMWKEGGNRVKWRPHIISTQALRSYPWPVGVAQTCLVHSFIHKNDVAKGYLELSNCQSWAESRYVPSSPKKNHADAGCYINLDTENLTGLSVGWNFRPFNPIHIILIIIFGPDCYIIVFLSMVFSSEFPKGALTPQSTPPRGERRGPPRPRLVKSMATCGSVQKNTMYKYYIYI